MSHGARLSPLAGRIEPGPSRMQCWGLWFCEWWARGRGLEEGYPGIVGLGGRAKCSANLEMKYFQN